MNHDTKLVPNIVQINEEQIHRHLGTLFDTVEETLNAMLDAEADSLCKATRYERSADCVDTRVGIINANCIRRPERLN